MEEKSKELNEDIDLTNFWDYEQEAEMEKEYHYISGKREGIEQGIEQGIEKGFEKGMQQQKIEMAKALLKQNIDISIIKTTTGLSEEEIKKL